MFFIAYLPVVTLSVWRFIARFVVPGIVELEPPGVVILALSVGGVMVGSCSGNPEVAATKSAIWAEEIFANRECFVAVYR